MSQAVIVSTARTPLTKSHPGESNITPVPPLAGPDGMPSGRDAVQDGVWQEYFLMQWASRIGGGTDQIQRNVLGERVLGLPPEPRLDKTMPFRDLPKA